MAEETEKFEGWAVVDVMGHSMYAGYVTSCSFGGDAFFRVDVPAIVDRWSGEAVEGFTKYLSTKSIFSFTPCTEAVARRAAESKSARPISIVDLRPQPALAPPAAEEYSDPFDDDDDD